MKNLFVYWPLSAKWFYFSIILSNLGVKLLVVLVEIICRLIRHILEHLCERDWTGDALHLAVKWRPQWRSCWRWSRTVTNVTATPCALLLGPPCPRTKSWEAFGASPPWSSWWTKVASCCYYCMSSFCLFCHSEVDLSLISRSISSVFLCLRMIC
jgi:hypothetical protein